MADIQSLLGGAQEVPQSQDASTMERLLGLSPRVPQSEVVPGAGEDQSGPVVEEADPNQADEFVSEPQDPVSIDINSSAKEEGQGWQVEPVGPDTNGFKSDEFIDLRGIVTPSVAVLKAQQKMEERYQNFQASISAAVPEGDNYNPDEKWSDGLRGFFAMADITRNDELHNKQKKFRSYYPNGSLIQVPSNAGLVLLARKEPGDPWRRLPITGRAAGAVFNESVVGGAAGSLVGGYGGPFVAGAGAAAGAVLKGNIEAARGYEADSYWDDAVAEGGIAFATDAISRGVGRVVFGRTRTKFEADALENAMQAAKDLNLEPLTTGQTGNFFTRKLFHQVGQTAESVKDTVTKQQRSLLDAFKKKGTINSGQPDAILNDIINAQHRELASMLNLKALSRADSGEALTEGIKWYRKSSSILRDRLYEKAIREGDDVSFFLEGVQSVARDINFGVRARGIQQRNAMGQFDTADLIRLSQTPEGKLASVIDDILALNPKMSKLMVDTPDGQKQWTAFEQIKTLRTRLFDLKNSDQADVRREATRLYISLTEAMDNPISGNPNFIRAYKQASGFNRLRETILDYTFVARALKNDSPDQLAAKYFRPGRSKELEAIKSIVPDVRWEEFRGGFRHELANFHNPQTALNRLKTFESVDPGGLDMLMTPVERKELTQFLIRKAQFQSSPAVKIMNRQMDDAEKFIDFAREGTVGEVREAVRLAGGLTSDYARTARAGIYNDILNRSQIINEQGVEIIDPRLMSDAILDWQRSGKLKAVMTNSDIVKLANISSYGRIVSDSGDIGGAMMGGQIRQQLVDLPAAIIKGDTGKIHGFAQKVLSNRWTAWVLTQNVRMGRVRGQRDLPLRELATSLSLATNQFKSSELGE